jgi:hypothetical protein
MMVHDCVIGGHLSLDEVRKFFSSFADAPIIFFEIDPPTCRRDCPQNRRDRLQRPLPGSPAEDAGAVFVTADNRLLRALHGMSCSRLAPHLADVHSVISGAG